MLVPSVASSQHRPAVRHDEEHLELAKDGQPGSTAAADAVRHDRHSKQSVPRSTLLRQARVRVQTVVAGGSQTSTLMRCQSHRTSPSRRRARRPQRRPMAVTSTVVVRPKTSCRSKAIFMLFCAGPRSDRLLRTDPTNVIRAIYGKISNPTRCAERCCCLPVFALIKRTSSSQRHSQWFSSQARQKHCFTSVWSSEREVRVGQSPRVRCARVVTEHVQRAAVARELAIAVGADKGSHGARCRRLRAPRGVAERPEGAARAHARNGSSGLAAHHVERQIRG